GLRVADGRPTRGNRGETRPARAGCGTAPGVRRAAVVSPAHPTGGARTLRLRVRWRGVRPDVSADAPSAGPQPGRSEAQPTRQTRAAAAVRPPDRRTAPSPP